MRYGEYTCPENTCTHSVFLDPPKGDLLPTARGTCPDRRPDCRGATRIHCQAIRALNAFGRTE